MGNKKFVIPKIKPITKEIGEGDLREVNLNVKVLFEWSDNIITDYNSETGEILEYTSGYIMKIIPNQEFFYNGEHTVFLGQTTKEIQ
jgi:hypothetical protein